MILRAAEELDIDLACSILLGDKETDIQAGDRGGRRVQPAVCA